MRQRGVLSRGAAATVITCCALLTAAPAGAAPAGEPRAPAAGGALPASGGSWGAPQLLGFSASTDVNEGADVGSMSCTVPGDCGIAGSYGDSSFNNQAFVGDEKSGRWQAAEEVPGTAALNSMNAEAVSVSCASAGNCAVGGDYQTASGDVEGFVASEVRGTWHDAAPVRGTVSANSNVNSVSCPTAGDSAGDCVAAGDFTDHAGRLQAFVAVRSHGTWGPAITVAARLNAGGSASVSSVSCVSAGNCAAGGFYSGKPGQTMAFTVDERHGVWSGAREVAGALNAGTTASITSISCASPGNCAAGGSYLDRARHTQAFLVTEKGGVWSAAREVAGALNVGGNATIGTVSCPSAGNCGAGGSYTAAGAGTAPPDNTRREAFVVSERHGVWSAAREAAGALNIAGYAVLETISCPSVGDCAAGGFYSVRNGLGHAFVVTERDGTWLAASEMAGNLDIDSGGSVDAISCTSAGDCTAGGAINDDAGTEPFVVTGSIIQPTSTTLALSEAKVRYGHEQSVRLSVSVRARYSGIPAGKVVIKAGAATICVIILKVGAGHCALTAKQLRPGTYHLAAVYTGSTSDLASTAARKTLTITG